MTLTVTTSSSAGALTDVEDPAPSTSSPTSTAVVDSMNDEAALTDAGDAGRSSASSSRALRNRIEVDAYVAEHPDVDDSPLAGADLPHRAAPLGHHLLPVPVRPGPPLRMLRTWEGERPVAAARARPRRRRRRRREASVETAKLMREATGGKIDAFHLTDVDGPQECLAILDQTFVNPGLLWTMSVFGYLEYLLHEADLHAAYEYHARVLQAAAAGCARAAVGAEVAVSPARARCHRRGAPRRRSSW